MKRVSLIFAMVMAIATLASAQATRTWVSGVGDDVNPCSRTAPCKTFAGAISKTASPGKINCLDPGGFGAVTITKSVTIDCTGTYGSVLSSGTQGIVINALTTDQIVLRAIDINGAGTTLGTNGVNIIQAASVHLFNVNVGDYSGQGVETTNSTNQISVFLEGCQILNAQGTGVLANSSGSGSTLLTVNNSHITHNGKGIDVEGPLESVEVSNSLLAKNAAEGFKLGATTAAASLESCSINLNATGVNAASGQTIRLSRNMIFQNTVNGVTGANTTCFGTNVIEGNIGSNTCANNGVAMH